MRVKNIEVQFKIPIKLNEPDLNSNFYTEEAIRNSLDSYKNTPIVIRNANNEQEVCGVIYDAYLEEKESYVICNGNIMFGGTDCLVSKSHRGENGLLVIDEFTIAAVGISK